MTDAEILTEAHDTLLALKGKKRWMTERGLAKRLRGRDAFRTLDHLRLRDVLMQHASEPGRTIRNSKAPSEKTLEVLWGAIQEGGVKEINNPLPVLRDLARRRHPDDDPQPREFEEDEEDADYFLSYRMLYEEQAFELVRALESRGWSVWIAGYFIGPGDHINQKVIDAMSRVRRQLIYVDESALHSLWVGKEALHGARLDLEQTFVLKGDDPGVVRRFVAMLNNEPDWFGAYGGASGGAVERFRELLEQRVAHSAAKIYLHPVPDSDTLLAHPRLASISEFPAFETRPEQA